MSYSHIQTVAAPQSATIDPVDDMAPDNSSSLVYSLEKAAEAERQNRVDSFNLWPSLAEGDTPHQKRDVSRNIAEGKVIRQDERIAQTEHALTAVTAVKPKTRGRTKVWKPFDFTESGDETTSSDEQSRDTPLDVHAKVFQPFTSSFDAYDNVPSLEDDWMLQLNKMTASSSGLNPYEIKFETRTPTVAAPFDKREINEVFGNDLPSPDRCQRLH